MLGSYSVGRRLPAWCTPDGTEMYRQIHFKWRTGIQAYTSPAISSSIYHNRKRINGIIEYGEKLKFLLSRSGSTNILEL